MSGLLHDPAAPPPEGVPPYNLNMGLSGQQIGVGRLGKGAYPLPLLGTYPQSLGRPSCTLLPTSTKLDRFQFDVSTLIFIFIAQQSTRL